MGHGQVAFAAVVVVVAVAVAAAVAETAVGCLQRAADARPTNSTPAAAMQVLLLLQGPPQLDQQQLPVAPNPICRQQEGDMQNGDRGYTKHILLPTPSSFALQAPALAASPHVYRDRMQQGHTLLLGSYYENNKNKIQRPSNQPAQRDKKCSNDLRSANTCKHTMVTAT